MNKFHIILACLLIISCSDSNETIIDNSLTNNEMYFPPINSDEWEEKSIESVDWNSNKLDDLYSFLESNNTRAFIVLKNGNIVIENYWGNNVLNVDKFDKNSNWYWASAGKTITSFLVGIAQENNLLSIQNKTSNYLGENWSSLSLEKENLITIRHQLTMTTGLDYTVENIDCTEPSCLRYKTDAGEQWYYHNAPYTLLENVVSNVSNLTYNAFCDNFLESKIGMDGTWIKSDYNNVYWSSARDAARFGLLILNEGIWENTTIMNDEAYFREMVSTSQNLNPSYGYLWWLNGKSQVIVPSNPNIINSDVTPSAPKDMISAMGKNGQFIDVIPSEGIVVVRFGEAPDNSLVPILFHNDMWQKLNEIIYN